MNNELLQIKIIQKPDALNPFVVIHKPSGLPSAPLAEGETFNAFAQAANLFPELYTVEGRQNCRREHGLLHRLDTVTSGLILIAATQKAFEFFQKNQEEGKIIKYYRSINRILPENAQKLTGFPPLANAIQNEFLADKKISLSSKFRPFGTKSREVRPVTEQSGMAAIKKACKKSYTTKISLINYDEKNRTCTIESQISAGFRHQIRCHLAWLGFPILNDELYDIEYSEQSKARFFFESYKIEFPHPLNGKKMVFSLH